MLAKKYRSEVVSIKNPLEGIYTVEFASLKGKYKYLPGQFLHIALDDEYDGTGQWPESRCFSMQSSPEDTNVTITYAVKGSFTQWMENQLEQGKEVWLKLPYGDLFQQKHSKTNTVFIAGGTGITPFLSLFNHSSFEEYEEPKIYLGFRSMAYNIYERELTNLRNASKNIEIFYEDSKGTIDIEYIFAQNGKSPTYFISGPPLMIRNFKEKLKGYGLPEAQILTDDWK